MGFSISIPRALGASLIHRVREEGEQYETRYYFDEKGRCIEVKSDEEETDYGYLSRHLANDLLFLFRAISQ